jgi:hypothetical protein
MGGLRIAGLFAVIPTAVLLTISFFVLFAMRKIETQGLKAFGYVVAALLWLATLVVFSAGVYTISTGRMPMKCPMMCPMMRGNKEGMMGSGMMPMMHGQGAMQPAQGKNQGMARGGNKGMMKCGGVDTSMGR